MRVCVLPVGSWSLVEQGRAPRAVLAPKASRAGHVVIRHCRGFDWLKSFIRSVTSARDRNEPLNQSAKKKPGINKNLDDNQTINNDEQFQ